MKKKDIIFKLNFKNDGFGIVQIDQPKGYESVELNLDQKTGLMGRDVSFSGSEYQFSFSVNRNHYFEKIMYYLNLYGFESDVELIIQETGFDDIIFELDFSTADTNEYDIFTCNAIQKASLQIVKRRKEVKVDLFSDKDVDGNYIKPLIPKNMLLLSKPVRQYSKWEQTSEYYNNLNAVSIVAVSRYYLINPCNNYNKNEISSTLIPFETTTKTNSTPENSDFKYVEAKTNLKNVIIDCGNLDIKIVTDVDNGGNGYIDIRYEIRYGNTYSSAITTTLFSTYQTEQKTFTFNESLPTINIPEIKRGEFIWINFIAKVRQSDSNIIFGVVTPPKRFEAVVTIKPMTISISADSTSYNTVVPTLRLIDVMKQVVKSISGLNVDAKRFENGGEFYDNVLFNGNLLRNAKKEDKPYSNLLKNAKKEDKPYPFYISLSDIEKSLTEMKGDWEIDSNENVFFGIEKDFYSNEEIWFFDNVQFSGTKKTSNPIYSLNEFGLKYKSYQSLKEGEELNSADAIHGESMWTFYNKKVENKKDVSIEWVRDPFMLKQQQEKSFEVTESTATQDDDTLFCVDIVNTEFDQSFIEVTTLNHAYNTTKAELSLTNNGEINFIILGIEVGSIFEIKSPDQNTGFYTVLTVGETTLTLSRNDTLLLSSANDGIRSTTYKYIISKDSIPFTNRTSEDITGINGLNIGDKFSNLRYSLKRNIENYYNSHIATANLWWKDKPLLNSIYKNNPDCTFTYDGITTVEGEGFVPKNPILSPFLYEEMVFANIEQWEWEKIQKLIRSKRGFFRTIDSKGKVIKIYPQKMKYSIGNEKITMTAEEKYEPIEMTINTNNPNYILINDTKIRKIDYEFIDDKLSIYDINRFRLFNPVYWFNVSVNGYVSKSQTELDNLLKLL